MTAVGHLLQGDEPAHDHGHPRYAAQAGGVRGTGHPHVLPVARRRGRTRADGAADPAAARPAGAAARAGQQDAEQPDGARLGSGDEHHRPGDPQQRQAARRDRRRRRDHRGQPRPGQGSRPEPVAVRGGRDLLARAAAEHGRRRAAALQPEHHHARHQRRRLLPHGAAGGRQLPRHRQQQQDHRQATTARHGRPGDHARSRRRDPGAEHDLRRPRWRRPDRRSRSTSSTTAPSASR